MKIFLGEKLQSHIVKDVDTGTSLTEFIKAVNPTTSNQDVLRDWIMRKEESRMTPSAFDLHNWKNRILRHRRQGVDITIPFWI